MLSLQISFVSLIVCHWQKDETTKWKERTKKRRGQTSYYQPQLKKGKEKCQRHRSGQPTSRPAGPPVSQLDVCNCRPVAGSIKQLCKLWLDRSAVWNTENFSEGEPTAAAGETSLHPGQSEHLLTIHQSCCCCCCFCYAQTRNCALQANYETIAKNCHFWTDRPTGATRLDRIFRSTDRRINRWIDRTMEQPNGDSTDRPTQRWTHRPIDRPTDRPTDRSTRTNQ